MWMLEPASHKDYDNFTVYTSPAAYLPNSHIRRGIPPPEYTNNPTGLVRALVSTRSSPDFACEKTRDSVGLAFAGLLQPQSILGVCRSPPATSSQRDDRCAWCAVHACSHCPVPAICMPASFF